MIYASVKTRMTRLSRAQLICQVDTWRLAPWVASVTPAEQPQRGVMEPPERPRADTLHLMWIQSYSPMLHFWCCPWCWKRHLYCPNVLPASQAIRMWAVTQRPLLHLAYLCKLLSLYRRSELTARNPTWCNAKTFSEGFQGFRAFQNLRASRCKSNTTWCRGGFGAN